MPIKFINVRAVAFAAGVAILAMGTSASADPPSRVARLGYASGQVSFSPAGENDWLRAAINRPLTTGDRLWVDSRARAELQVGGAVVRMGGNTSVSILNLDDRIAQLRLSQGTLNVHVRRLGRNQVFEVDTPNLAFTLQQPGEYRITVDADGYSTDIMMRRGQGEAYGDGAAYLIDARQGYSFTGSNLREYEYFNPPRLDEFDRWSMDRDRRYESSISARYVSQDVIGYEDLDANGVWRTDASYGSVWYPNRVASGWAPYRDGHWSWVDPWGWTWVDDAPWGFAVSHYGRWANLRGTWGWVPGPVRERAYYAPALVAFVGGNNFQISISSGSVGGIGWFPLAPREIYQPSYTVSRGYFENINRSNTVINNTVINNTVINNNYNNSTVTNIVYANRSVPGAVVAVPTTTFVQSQPVARAAVVVSQQMIASAPVAVVPRIAPTPQSVRGAAVQSAPPPPAMFDRAVVARSAPPPPRVGFAAQQQQLTAAPGTPLDDGARQGLRAATTVAPAPVVKIVAPAQIAPPTALPPPVAPSGGRGSRGNSEDRRVPASPAAAGAPVMPGMAPQVAQPLPPGQAPDQRGRSEQRGNRDPREARGQSYSPPPAAPTPPQNVAPAPVAPPQAVPQAPAAQPQDQRGRSEQRGNRDQRGQPVAPPAAPPQAAAPAPVAPPAAVPQAPAAQAEQRGNRELRDQRGQPVAPPQAAPPRPMPPQAAPPQAAPPPVASPQAVPSAPVATPAEQRGRPEQRGRAAPPPPPPVPGAEPDDDPKPVGKHRGDRKKSKEERDDEEDRKKKQ